MILIKDTLIKKLVQELKDKGLKFVEKSIVFQTIDILIVNTNQLNLSLENVQEKFGIAYDREILGIPVRIFLPNKNFKIQN